jgi:hypothetical protein
MGGPGPGARMSVVVPFALFGWPAVVLLLFYLMRPRRAVIASVILAWLLLPVAGFKFSPGIPAYNKIVATCLGALLGIAIFDFRRLLSFRPRWVDLPMAVWCLSPFAASLSNDLGAYDGLSAMFGHVMGWGLPYLFGRIYFSNLIGIAELAVGIFMGGLLYVPLCLLEIRLSPQLHSWVYGFYQHDFSQTIRFGGWRPTVFMDHGLMVGMWMSMASLVGSWLWISGTLRSLFRVPLPWLCVPLLATTVLCKSFGALVLLLMGLVLMLGTRLGSIRIFVIALALLAPIYCAVRIPGLWSAGALTEASATVSNERAGSLKFRLDNEDILVAKAMKQPVFGWGAWGRGRVYDSEGRDISVTDGLWIIELGNHGFVGLTAMLSVFMVALVGLIRAVPGEYWRHRLAAPAVALCVMVLLYELDCIFNALNNPIYTMGVGALACLRIGAVKRLVRAAAPAKDIRWAPRSSSLS